ncbi:helix-turn-helix domain-containing protein [Candidatus Binatus sp.]|uniref:helix-turn-helix domain-containing protein n=1 Tax=Candidatus Binatus sp. TaxID=2811406 RepID=UPI003BB054F6
MTQSKDFSLRALFDALDAQRQARGLSWSQVIKEMHEMHQRPATARRLSASTMTGTRTRSAAEGDGVLAMLRWLNRTPESFMPGHRESEQTDARLPNVPPGKVLRFDSRKIYAALDALRIERKMTWAEVAKEIGTNSASLLHLSKGKRVVFPGVMRILRWLGRPAADFTRASDN